MKSSARSKAKAKAATKTAKKRRPSNWHTISLNAEAFRVLRAERSHATPPTYSGAVIALDGAKRTIAAPTTALIDLTSADMQAPKVHFTSEQAAIKGCESLRDEAISSAALIERAASFTGIPIADFIKLSVLDAAKKRVLDHHRAQAGATNAKGSADAKILAAIEDLKGRGEPVTVARVRAMTGCNRLAVERHVAPTPRIPTVVTNVTNSPSPEAATPAAE